MPNIGPVELIIILVIALIVIGPGRLPEVGSALGKSIREFRKASSDVADSTRLDPAPAPPATAPMPPPAAPAPDPVSAAPAAPIAPTAPAVPDPVLTPPAPRSDDESTNLPA